MDIDKLMAIAAKRGLAVTIDGNEVDPSASLKPRINPGDLLGKRVVVIANGRAVESRLLHKGPGQFAAQSVVDPHDIYEFVTRSVESVDGRTIRLVR